MSERNYIFECVTRGNTQYLSFLWQSLVNDPLFSRQDFQLIDTYNAAGGGAKFFRHHQVSDIVEELLIALLAIIGLLFSGCGDSGSGSPAEPDTGNGGDFYPGTKAGGGTALSAPANVLASSSSASEITISWDPVSGADEYKIYKSESASGTYSLVSTVSSTTYTDTGLSAETTRYYKVSANAPGNGRESPQSSYVQALTCYIPVAADYTDLGGNKVEITGYTESSSTSINIPAEIEGKALVSIGTSAFSSKQLESVIIPDSVTAIGIGAFYDTVNTPCIR